MGRRVNRFGCKAGLLVVQGLALAACEVIEPEPGAFAVSEAAQRADWPDLLTSEEKSRALAGLGVRLTDTETTALQARAKALQARGAALARRAVVTDEERRRLAALLKRRKEANNSD